MPLYEIPGRARRQQPLARPRVPDDALARRVGGARVRGEVGGRVALRAGEWGRAVGGGGAGGAEDLVLGGQAREFAFEALVVR